MLVGPITALVLSILALIATIYVVRERDVLKAIVYSGLQSAAYAVMLELFFAPDLLIAYIAVSLGVLSVLFIYVLMKGERYEECCGLGVEGVVEDSGVRVVGLGGRGGARYRPSTAGWMPCRGGSASRAGSS